MKIRAATVLALLVIAGCSASAQTRYLSIANRDTQVLDTETLLLNASAGPLNFRDARVITDNDESFESKLELIREAKRSIDLAYYIFSTDYSSSLIAQELINSARRGVRVRLLVDYFSNYSNLDFFSMLEHYGNQGSGSLRVRFYNRPTEIILKDAFYVTLGCHEVGKDGELHGCSKRKFNEIERRLSESQSTVDPDPTNFSSAWSSLFLSGLYAKDPKLMAFAIVNGQKINLASLKGKDGAPEATPDEKAKKYSTMLEAVTIYWKSRGTNDDVLERVAASIKLSLAFTLVGTKLNPLYDMITGYLPVGERSDAEAAIRDWDFLTEFLHHKFLLVDNQHLLIGGRNIEDSYHMVKNPLVDKYVFMDTDLKIDLADSAPELSEAYERLWSFRTMVAELRDVKAHAPNDFLQARKRVDAKCGVGMNELAIEQFQTCVQAEFEKGLNERSRIAERLNDLEANVKIYLSQYTKAPHARRSPAFSVDHTAELYYLENLPFEKSPRAGMSVRNYGAINGLEGESGKYLHNVWLAGLRNACAKADAEHPQEIILHSAYFFLPSNLLRELGEMVDGTRRCENVQITVITNSEDTTDLKIINLAARSSMKAFADYYRTKRDPRRGAEFRAFIYKRQGANEKRSDASLHSKVSILGPDMIVGSANADVRSYMLDSNNGVLIRNAPMLHAAYRKWLETILTDSRMTIDAWHLLSDVTPEELIRRDTTKALAAFETLTGTSSGGSSAVLQTFEQLMRDVLFEDYSLSKRILEGGWGREQAERRFNSFFKLL